MPSPVVITNIATGQQTTVLAAGEPWQMHVPVARITETDRPNRPSATRWDGYPARRLTGNAFLNAFPDGSVEPTIQALTALAQPGPMTKPAVVTVHGDTVPPQAALVRFMVAGFEWGDLVRRSDGARCRQAFTIELVEDVQASTTVKVRPAPRYRFVVAKKGETIQKLAQRVLKDARKASQVVALNKPWAKKAGQVITPAGRKVRVPA